MLDAIKFQESVFALPFAYIGMTLAAGGFPGWRTFALITVAMVAARTVGMAANRVIDRHIDAANPRSADRHLPRGLLSAFELKALAVASFVVFIAAAAMLNTLTLALAPVAAAYLVAYPYTKRFTWAANLLLGWALAISPSAAWIGVTGSLSLEPVLMSVAVAMWAGSFDFIYHAQDVDFHRANGLHSVAARFGVGAAFRIAKIMDVVAVGCLVSLGAYMGLAWPYYVGCAVSAAVLVYKYALVSPSDLSSVGHGVRADQRRRVAVDARGRSVGRCTYDAIVAGPASNDAAPVVVGVTGASGAALAAHTHRRAAGRGRAGDRVGVAGGANGLARGDGRVVRRGNRTLDGLGPLQLRRPDGDDGGDSQRHVPDAGHGDSAVQHGDGGGSRLRPVRQPNPPRRRRHHQRAPPAGRRAARISRSVRFTCAT